MKAATAGRAGRRAPLFSLGHRLKEWRIERNLSQREVAAMLEIDVMTISRWERGVQGLRLDTIYRRRIERLLGVER